MLKRLFHFHTTQQGINKPVLCMCVGDSHVSLAICESHNGELLHVSYFSGEVSGENLASLFLENPELNHDFLSVQVSFHYGRNIMVPLTYFTTGKEKTLLDAAHGTYTGTREVADLVNEWQLHNVYSVPADVLDWVRRKFPANNSRHHLTLAIKSMPAESADRLLIDIHTNEFSLIAIRENKLLLAQTHCYSSFDDILYMLLKICQQFSLSQDKVQLLVSGLVEKESQLYREMHQYFIKLELREPDWSIGNTEEPAYPSHYFTTLNDLAKCVS